MKYPRVTVQVVNFNGGEKILRCLSSVQNLNYPNFEVVILDNGSSDGTKEQIKNKFKKFKLLENGTNLGWVRAVEKGFKMNKNPLILQLDDDVSVKKDLLTKLVREIMSSKNIGIVIPKVYYYKMPNIISNIGFFINLSTGKTTTIGRNEEDKGQHNKKRELKCVPAAVMLVKKEVLDRVGMVSLDYFQYYGDAEWCLNVWKAGYKIVYFPGTKAWHDEKIQKEMPPFKLSHYISDKIIFMKRNSPFPKKYVYFLILLFIYTPLKLFQFAISLKFSSFFAYIKGIFRGIFYFKK